MDGDTLSMTADCLAAASGSCLTAEQRAMLPTSLGILKNEHGFSKVFYWGRLQGTQGDYHIAQGLGQAIGDKKEAAIRTGGDLTVAEFFNNLSDVPKQFFRLGPDGVSWSLLPAVDQEASAAVAEWTASLREQGKVFTPLVGSASHKYEYTVTEQKEGEEEPASVTKELSEEIRLAHMVAEIDAACGVVPVGAVVLNSSQRVVFNPYFKGLSLSEALKLESFLHLRRPTELQKQPLAERAAMSKSTQFLDKVAYDAPKGCWSLKHDPPNNMVVLRSLVFPGYTHFSVIGSAMFGGGYFGNGAKNHDLAFML